MMTSYCWNFQEMYSYVLNFGTRSRSTADWRSVSVWCSQSSDISTDEEVLFLAIAISSWGWLGWFQQRCRLLVLVRFCLFSVEKIICLEREWNSWSRSMNVVTQCTVVVEDSTPWWNNIWLLTTTSTISVTFQLCRWCKPANSERDPLQHRLSTSWWHFPPW